MKRLMTMLLSLAMLLSLCACGQSSHGDADNPSNDNRSATDLDPITLTIGHSGTEDSWNQTMCLAIKDELYKLSDGKITVNVYPNSLLGSDAEMIISVINGDLSMQCTNTAGVTHTVTDCGVVDIPFILSDVAEVRKVFSDETFISLMKDSFNESNLHLLMLADQGFRCITSNKNITKFEDLAGLQIRVQDNPNQISIFKDATLAPTPLAFSELYLALQQGLLQAQENPYRTTVASKFYEVQDYVTNSNHVPQCNVLFMGKNTYDNLPKAYQEIVDVAFNNLVPVAQQIADESMSQDLEFLQEKGMTFIDFDQIEGLRDTLKERCVDNAVARTRETVKGEVVDAYLSAAGYKSN